MQFNIFKKTIQLPDGRIITLETGKLARQADGAVELRMGNTVLLATVVSSKKVTENLGFLPLSVDYQEKFAAAGRIPGGFTKREGKLSEYEILISRLIDRAMRPLFPDDYFSETQINVFLMSADKNVPADALAGLAAAAAVTISDVPFNGPMSEVRVAKINGQLIINPSLKELENATIDLIVGASYKDIVMVEGEMSEVSEEEMLEAIQFAHEAIKVQCKALADWAAEIGVKKREFNGHVAHKPELKEQMRAAVYQKIYDFAKQGIADKALRNDTFASFYEEFTATLTDEQKAADAFLLKTYYHDIHKEAVRNLVMDEKIRLDNRKPDEIRPIYAEVDLLPAAHGSSLFTRGETQSLTTVTLGTKLDEQQIDGATYAGYNKLMLHYNFPGFSTGEVKPNRGPGRREIGHGNLAFRALKKIIPADSDNPYTIRIVSDILESNGSSSMATVCAGSLALFDAGIDMKKHVSGIAMGLITDTTTGRYAVLSDILGDEDHLGDMDFKVTGTRDGITACQMDLKVDGLPYQVMKEALEQAKKGRLHILDILERTIPAPRPDLKDHAPRVVAISIPKELIGAVIGPGGKVVQDIQKTSGATVVIEELENNGLVRIFASNGESLNKAVTRVKAIVVQPEVGETYEGKVKAIQPYGAFVEFIPGKDGFLHISELKWERVNAVEDVLKIGDTVQVKLIEVDVKKNQMRLSMKALQPKPEGFVEQPKQERSENGGGNNNRDRRDRPNRERYN
jgi:polyribonucleotide nucleotidyltransferase